MPQYPATFRSSASAPDPFSLPALLKACEHPGYKEATQPPGMTMEMFPFQRQTLQVRLSAALRQLRSSRDIVRVRTYVRSQQRGGVQWMLDHERLPGGLNALFWEKRKWVDSGDGDDDCWYYMPTAGELRLQTPPEVRVREDVQEISTPLWGCEGSRER